MVSITNVCLIASHKFDEILINNIKVINEYIGGRLAILGCN